MNLTRALGSLAPSLRLGCVALLLGLAFPPGLSAQVTFTVTTTDDLDDGTCDVGHCSLREAITAANNTVGGGMIHFNIPGGGPHTIQPASPLPAIEDDIVLDGTTEPDFAGTPVIELDGSMAGPTNGLDVAFSNNTIRGLVINRFAWNGIQLNPGVSNILIEGNFIGTDVTGTIDLGNGSAGVFIGDAPDNTVGGPSAGARNLISGNAEGVQISGIPATGNRIIGNYIGTDWSGSAAIPNHIGVLVLAPENFIGGTAAGAGNLVSGNTSNGVDLGPPNATGNVILGNYIGVDVTGSAALGNDIGVFVNNVADNLIGGTSVASRNVVSGNREGIALWDPGATGNLIQGNYVGTNASGDAAIPNETGAVVYGPANTIGGQEAGAGNLISGNQINGLNIFGENAAGNMVQGNLIGTNASGTAALGNGEMGIGVFSATETTIGGTESGAANTISGNGLSGVLLFGAEAQDNLIQGNLLGTDPSGSTAIGNGESGVQILSAASNNTIGGTAAGAGNVLSGNTFGILIGDSQANGNTIQGNHIGTNATGEAEIPNTQTGILLWSHNTIIGGAETGAGNVISGNNFAGIDLGGGSSGTLIQGNLIGTDATGTMALGNDLGIFVNFSADNTIGGTQSGAGNVISGNVGNAITVNGLDATGNLLQGNYVGTDGTGTGAVGNGAGLTVLDAPGNTIGGTHPGARNVISGNAGNSLMVTGLTATGNIVQGNYIGTDVTGTAAMENEGGVWIMDAPDNTIGGTESGAGNLISGNTGGIRVDGPNASGNVIQGNTLGMDATGASAMSVRGAGVRFSNGAFGNMLGGSQAGAGNIIANSSWVGVVLFADAGTGNLILSNSIFDSGALGIDLNRDTPTPNDDLDLDTGPNNLQNFPVLLSVASSGGAVIQADLNSAPNSSYTLDFFSNAACDPTGFGEGETPLGTAALTTDASGNGTVTTSFSSVTGTVFTATATDADGNTSEFSSCGEVTALGVQPSPTTRTVTAGQPAIFTIDVTAQGGIFEETVALSCSGAPAGATCIFTADQVTLAAGLASTTMTVTTVAPALSFPGVPPEGSKGPGRSPWALLLALSGLWLLLEWPGFKKGGANGRGRPVGYFARVRAIALVAGWTLLISLQASCGDSGTSTPSGGTTPGSYQLTVTATWESVQQSATATLVVQ